MNYKRPLFRDGRCPPRWQERFQSSEGLECSFAITSAVPPRKTPFAADPRSEHPSGFQWSQWSIHRPSFFLRRLRLHSNQASTDVRGPRVRELELPRSPEQATAAREPANSEKVRAMATNASAGGCDIVEQRSFSPTASTSHCSARRNLLMFFRSHRSCSCHSGHCAAHTWQAAPRQDEAESSGMISARCCLDALTPQRFLSSTQIPACSHRVASCISRPFVPFSRHRAPTRAPTSRSGLAQNTTPPSLTTHRPGHTRSRQS
ncbi:hypothetical protein FKP32DRAFT_869384 [Trametes sanguinea]|nr:hypothetical protein FKP32DRAFT_869384 [Trametes sanguinea]